MSQVRILPSVVPCESAFVGEGTSYSSWPCSRCGYNGRGLAETVGTQPVIIALLLKVLSKIRYACPSYDCSGVIESEGHAILRTLRTLQGVIPYVEFMLLVLVLDLDSEVPDVDRVASR